MSTFQLSDKHKLLVKKIMKRMGRRDPLSNNYNEWPLPLFTIDEVRCFNNRVNNDDYRHFIMDRLKKFWDPDLRKAIKTLFEKIMDYSVIILYSWTGKTATPGKMTPKEKFCAMEGIFELFVDFCNAGPVCHPDKKIVAEIQLFLKRANQTFRRINHL